MSVATPRPQEPTAAQTRRAIWNTIRGSLGNLVEWYDVYIYAAFAKFFENQFFDASDKSSTVYVWAVFAVTFVMRPVGSWFFGRFADRHGRRAALTFSVSLMALGSLVIAVTPGRATLGVGSAIILIACRLLQGFATGGEYGTSATYMSEAATKNRRGFFSSFQYVTLVGGQVLATLTLLIIQQFASTEQIEDWGWRIPFLIGAVAALTVLWLRRSMDESLSHDHLARVKAGEDRRSGTMTELFGQYWRALLLVFLITMGGTIAFYTYSVNAPSIVSANESISATTATVVNFIGLLILMFLQPVGGLISDKVGRRPLLIWFGAGGVIYTWILIFGLRATHSAALSLLLMVIGFVFLVGYTSINAIVKAEQFPAHVRALGVGLGYALANSAFGGTAPLIYQALSAVDLVWVFVMIVTIAIAISLVVYIFFLKDHPETYLDTEHQQMYAAEAGDS